MTGGVSPVAMFIYSVPCITFGTSVVVTIQPISSTFSCPIDIDCHDVYDNHCQQMLHTHRPLFKFHMYGSTQLHSERCQTEIWASLCIPSTLAGLLGADSFAVSVFWLSSTNETRRLV